MQKYVEWRKIRNEEGWGLKKDDKWRRMRTEEGWGIKKDEE